MTRYSRYNKKSFRGSSQSTGIPHPTQIPLLEQAIKRHASFLLLFLLQTLIFNIFNMPASTVSALEREDHSRDAAFNKAMHGKSAQAKGGIAAMFSKGSDAKKAAVDEYFKHWDNKPAANETEEQRAVS